jgi:hypothetical protein
MPRLTKSAPKKKKAARIKSELHKFKVGTMRSGSKTGPKVKSRKQAVAIALSESGQSKKRAQKAQPKVGKSGDSNRRPRNRGRS